MFPTSFFFSLSSLLLYVHFPVNLQHKLNPTVMAGGVFNLHYAWWHWQKGEESERCLHRGDGIKSRERSFSWRTRARETVTLDTSWHTIRAHCTLGASQLVSVVFKFFSSSSVSVQAITRSDRRDTLCQCRNLSAVCGNYWCPWYLMWNGDGNL